MATASDSVQKFIADLDSVRVHKSPDGTLAKKKPLTLLVVLRRILRGELTENNIRFSELEAELRSLIGAHGSASTSSPNPAEPFYYLRTSPFWHIHIGDETRKPRKVSASQLRRPGTHASIDEKLFVAFSTHPNATRQAMLAILKKWWPDGAPQELTEHLGLK